MIFLSFGRVDSGLVQRWSIFQLLEDKEANERKYLTAIDPKHYVCHPVMQITAGSG